MSESKYSKEMNMRNKELETKLKEREREIKKLSDELKLVKQVEKVFNDSDKTYGYRAMQNALKNEGIVISEYKIRRIMRENMIIS